MRRAATILTGTLLLTASAAWAAYSALPTDDLMRPDPRLSGEEIVIKVPAADLERCIATLMNVMQSPVDPDMVTEISDDMMPSPTVRCVAE